MSRQVSETAPDDAPVVDRDAVRDRYLRHQAVRRAKIEHRRRTKRAGTRFWLVLLLLVVGFLVIAVSTWREIGQLFGL
ncbi:MAG: hypothetical protein U0R50_01115 [Gaiellales bacterium]